MNRFLHIGFDAFVNVGRVKMIVQADAEKLRRELKKRNIERASSSFWDATCGKEVKSFLLLDDSIIIASAVSAETLIKRNCDLKTGGKSNDGEV